MSDFSKIKRYFDTSKVAAGLASRLIGEKYLNIEINDEEYATLLKETLGQLKGPFMKVAQFLTTIPDTLPKEYYDLLALQSHAPPMGKFFVKRRLINELGNDWQTKFKSFDLTPAFAASLGQVHKAISRDGLEKAVKLQYPNMDSVLDADLGQLKFLFFLYEKVNKAIDTKDVYEELKEKLYQELDYELETENATYFREFFEENNDIIIPKIDKELSTKKMITMSWIKGHSILSYEKEDQEIKNSLGRLLFLSWYEPLYREGVLHGDPHPGNYAVVKDIDNQYKLALFDFGCIRRFSQKNLNGIKQLFYGILDEKLDQCVFAFEELGFKNLNKELIDVILQWAKLLYDPLIDDSIRIIQKNYTPKMSFNLAQEVHQKLKEKGGIRPPQSFVFLDRAAVGIGSVLMRLQAKQNWHKLLMQLIQN